jgi:hypothetical protein
MMSALATVVVVAAVVAAVAVTVGGATRPQLRYGEPGAVNAIRLTAPDAAAPIDAITLGDLAADLSRIMTHQPQGPATDHALTILAAATLAVDEDTARQVVMAVHATACPLAATPYGLP